METNRHWSAKWIWTGELPVDPAAARTEIAYFRRTFDFVPTGGRLVLRVSADSRYRLYLNGASVLFGPCKGDGHVHYYETADVTALLKAGRNTLAAKVVHYAAHEPHRMGAAGPVSVFRSAQGAFLLEGALRGEDGRETPFVATDGSWRGRRDTAIRYEEGEMGKHYMGYPERVDGGQLPRGWTAVDYDDSGWSAAVPVSSAALPTTGELTPWYLTERPIPLLYEEPRSFVGVMRTEGTDIAAARGWCGGEPLLVPPGSRIAIDLAAERLVTGFLQLELEDGAGSKVRLLCSECYEAPPGPNGERNKGIRDDASPGRILLGDSDSYRVAGVPEAEGSGRGATEIYEPFWFRTFRYVRLTVETAERPLLLKGLNYRETGYPLEAVGEFECSEPEFGPLWTISLNTLRNCMHETYEDCPFYEQLQYTMDTMMQAVFTYQVSGDDRLARRAIHDFHSSMLPNGMLQCRYPSMFRQVIPGFSLYWIFMLHDHYRHFGDAELIVRYRPSMEQVLDWFERQKNGQGLVGSSPEGYWSFVDWVAEWMEQWGVPTASRHGPITVYSLMYAAALDRAAELNEHTGRSEAARDFAGRAERVREAVRATCFAEERGLFRDGPSVAEYSQHTQIWAVLSGTATGTLAQSLMRSVLADGSLAQVSFSMSYFLFRALAKSGMYEASFPLWKKWTDQVALSLTTWMEDLVTQRSDCHGWGAVPLYEFPAEILGVKPALPGFDAIIVAPSVGPLQWARGKVATRHGLVSVDWRIADDGEFRLTVEAPQGIPVELLLPDGSRQQYADASLPVQASCRAAAVAARQ
ncbi:alpha-L-rhamnosidase-related protein [Cohnella fermenti]|uniref:Alpha-L-rhamnosidase n=1 Tax=Cohnella fermenti TaxID=2565925 RepID=A0A4S4C841_9BACL|nr:alpha-L-rhamnosidase C-terminal domain-containing protein [Cohnella fermenti]THF84097.1 hypothetical protein E6C55_01965 [Cohnella fermenti]